MPLAAINKPAGITSAQVVRDIVSEFTKSNYFKPWIVAEKARRKKESSNQRRRRRNQEVEIKVGHGGTLDPSATGCLVIGIGQGTKQLQSFIESRKSYDAVVLFGAATDSYDADGKILATAPYEHITRDQVEERLEQFKGDIQQVPPIFSALKMDGKKLYEYAREGKEPPRKIEPRAMKVYSLEMTDWLEPGSHEWRWPIEQLPKEEAVMAGKLLNLKQTSSHLPESPGLKRKRSASPQSAESKKEQKVDSQVADAQSGKTAFSSHTDPDNQARKPPAAKLTMDVGSGFYVRSLCHDLGKAVGSLGLMSHLVRTRQGPFSLDKNVLQYDDLKAGEETWKLKIQAAFQEWQDHVNPGKAASAPAAGAMITADTTTAPNTTATEPTPASPAKKDELVV